MDKLISTDEIKSLAVQFGYEVAALKAVMIVEASNTGFDPKTGKIKIQFEPHHFKRMKIENEVEVQAKEWEAFEKASKINADEAMLATSWGLGQIMGFNFKEAGYKSVSAMVNEFKTSEYYQFKGMLNFINSQPALRNALKKKDWASFAKGYNGKDYKKFNYDTRLEVAYNKAKQYV